MDEKKHILLIMAHLEGAGAEKACIDLLKNFDKKRYRITLLLIYNQGTFLSEVPGEIEIVPLYDRIPRKWHEKLLKRFPEIRNRGIRGRLGRVVGDEKYDAIISYCEGLPVIAHSFLLEHGQRNLTWVHCDMLKYPWTRRYFMDSEEERRMYSRMDRIIFVSDEAASAFEKKYGIEGKSMVIPNVIDRESIIRRSEEMKMEKPKFTVINIGRLVPVKNHMRLIDMMSILKNRNLDVQLRIVGEGPLLGRLREYAKRKEVSDNVQFLGFQTNPYPYLKASDVYVMSSDAEGYSLTVSEAICLGIPVVSTPVARVKALKSSGAAEIVDFSATSMADAVERFVIMPDRLAEFSRNALRYRERFRPETVMERIYACLSN